MWLLQQSYWNYYMQEYTPDVVCLKAYMHFDDALKELKRLIKNHPEAHNQGQRIEDKIFNEWLQTCIENEYYEWDDVKELESEAFYGRNELRAIHEYGSHAVIRPDIYRRYRWHIEEIELESVQGAGNEKHKASE